MMNVNPKNICKDYVADEVTYRGRRRTVCTYWDFDNPGLCKHPDHNVCLVYLQKHGLPQDGVIGNLIQDFALTLDKVK